MDFMSDKQRRDIQGSYYGQGLEVPAIARRFKVDDWRVSRIIESCDYLIRKYEGDISVLGNLGYEFVSVRPPVHERQCLLAVLSSDERKHVSIVELKRDITETLRETKCFPSSFVIKLGKEGNLNIRPSIPWNVLFCVLRAYAGFLEKDLVVKAKGRPRKSE